jgi:putative nucleotidyltransferase with HDIG domain
LAVLAYAYANVSPWTVVLFVAPAFAAQRLFILYRQQRDTAEALVTANHRLEEVNLSFASALVATLDARDQYTAGHSAAVAVYARDIADQLGLPPDQQRLAYLCGLVHDIGKIGLPPGLLEKPGALDAEERRQMEAHPLIGETIVQKVEDYSEVAGAVRHHHERIDGTGYPDRRYGDDIPLMARIISVADAYNAMTSNRPYRDAMPTNIARARLRDSAGTQFDPTVVDAFDRVLAREPESYRRARRADFEIDTQPSSPALLEAA